MNKTIEEIIKRNINVKNDFTYSMGNVVEELTNLVQKEREELKDDLEFAIRASLIEGDKYCDRKVLETNLETYLQTKGVK